MDCGNLISSPTALRGQGRCLSCSRKGELSWNYKTLRFGKNHPNWKGGWKENLPICIDCGKKLSYNKSIRCHSCNGKHLYKTNIKYRKQLMFPKRVTYYRIGKYLMRSSWEVLFSKFLTLSNIKWEYEPKTFNLGYTTYTPDFYLPEFDCYIEIKGWFRPKSQEKFIDLQKQYPDIVIHLFDQYILSAYLGVNKRQLSTYYSKKD